MDTLMVMAVSFLEGWEASDVRQLLAGLTEDWGYWMLILIPFACFMLLIGFLGKAFIRAKYGKKKDED